MVGPAPRITQNDSAACVIADRLLYDVCARVGV
jgi:hypothetical protein